MIANFKKLARWPAMAPVLFFAVGLVSLTDAQTDSTNGKSEFSSAGPRSGLTLRKVSKLPDDFWLASDVAPDGSYILGLTHGGEQMLFDLTSGAKRRIPPALDELRFSAGKFMPDGQQLIGGLRQRNSWRGIARMDLETDKIQTVFMDTNKQGVGVMDVSPDGTRLLARYYDNVAYELGTVLLSNGSLQTIKRFTTNSYPGGTACFSPDGRWIVYEHSASGNRGDISVVATDRSLDVPIVEHPAKDELLGWAPSGDLVLFASDRRGTWDAFTVQIKDGKPAGEPTLLKEGISKRPLFGGIPQSIGFTRNGAFYYLAETDAYDVYAVSLDPVTGKAQGRPSKIANVEESNQFPTWSPNSRLLAYVSRRGATVADGTPEGMICIRDFENGTVRELVTDAGPVSFPRWSPDGRSLFAISWAKGKRLAFRVDAESGKSSVLTEGVGVLYGTWPMWSWAPDGKSFYQLLHRTNMVRHNIETKEKTQIILPTTHFNAILSPNGENFAFSSIRVSSNSVSRTINIVSARGGKTRQLLELSGPEVVEEFRSTGDRGMGWTPDSQYVLFIKGDAQKYRVRSLWRVPVTGGEAEALGVEMYELREPVISPDGRRLAFTGGGIMGEVWVMENFLPVQKTAAK